MTGGSPDTDLAPLPRGTSIIIPAWNDCERLRPTVEYLIAGLDATGAPYEIMVVTDGCSDGTSKLVRSYGKDNVRVLEFPVGSGRGARSWKA